MVVMSLASEHNGSKAGAFICWLSLHALCNHYAAAIWGPPAAAAAAPNGDSPDAPVAWHATLSRYASY